MDWNDKYQTVSPKITIFWEIWKKQLLLQKIKNLSEKQKYQDLFFKQAYSEQDGISTSMQGQKHIQN